MNDGLKQYSCSIKLNEQNSYTVIINTALVEVCQLLKSIGFKIYDENDYPSPSGFNADFDLQIADPSRIVMLESEISRNMMCIILSNSINDGSYDYEVYVQDDIGCGWANIPLRWSEISLYWLTHLKMAIEGHGFTNI